MSLWPVTALWYMYVVLEKWLVKAERFYCIVHVYMNQWISWYKSPKETQIYSLRDKLVTILAHEHKLSRHTNFLLSYAKRPFDTSEQFVVYYIISMPNSTHYHVNLKPAAPLHISTAVIMAEKFYKAKFYNEASLKTTFKMDWLDRAQCPIHTLVAIEGTHVKDMG